MDLKDSKDLNWKVVRTPSIFTSRAGKFDVSVRKEAGHGMRDEDGRRYETQALYAAEDGEVLRMYGNLPPEITPELLVQCGFITPTSQEEARATPGYVGK